MSDSPLSTPPPRRAVSRHLATGPYGAFQKPASPPLRTPFLNFRKAMRRELLATDPDMTNSAMMNAVMKAWNELPPEARQRYAAGEAFKPRVVPAKRAEDPPTPVKAGENSDLCEAETGQSDSFPVDARRGWTAVLGGVLRKVADYFVVRPF